MALAETFQPVESLLLAAAAVDGQMWEVLLDVLTLLLVALLLGAICERLRQSAILGYLLAGTILGPNALGLVSSQEEVAGLAELGVALLLFTIGLEFSWKRLKRMGPATLGGGAAQILVTMGVVTALVFVPGSMTEVMPGVDFSTALALGAIIALSSTASVLRLLAARAELESVHGRDSLGILLVQDIAVVPLVLLVSVLGGGGTPGAIAFDVLKTIGLALVLIGGFYVLFNFVVPHILGTRSMQRNRELPVLMAIVVGLGSAWAAHRMGISPAMGAFVAGILLAESPFATQIRADVSSLRTLLMTLFFSAIGMVGDPVWIAENWLMVTAVVAAIILGKIAIIWGVLRMVGRNHPNAIATGLCLAQVGEFSFVLAAVARDGGVIDEYLFQVIVSATIGSLFLTPYMVAQAAGWSSSIARALQRLKLIKPVLAASISEAEPIRGHVVIVGFGPAGQAVCEGALRDKQSIIIVDLNSRTIAEARRLGYRAYIGDAGHPDVLEHLHVGSAAAVVITIPDPAAARSIIQMVRALGGDARVIVRARYHVYRWELEFSGAHVVIDEEQHVGKRLAAELRKQIRAMSE